MLIESLLRCSPENKTLNALLNLPFWLYSIGAPFAFAALGFYLTLGYRILGIVVSRITPGGTNYRLLKLVLKEYIAVSNTQ